MPPYRKAREHRSPSKYRRAASAYMGRAYLDQYDGLNPQDLVFDVYRAGTGLGGQSVNTAYSGVRITHTPTGLHAICQEHKSEVQNKNQALADLRKKVIEYATTVCAKCKKPRPQDDYLCERCRSIK